MGDNRIIVKHGLRADAINHMLAYGFMALLEESRIPVYDLTEEDVKFKIAPKINAAGRMLHPDIAFNLLAEHDKQLAEPMAEYLINFNEERKVLQKKIEQEAIEIVKKQNPTHGIMVCNEAWHIGIVGIVASRLTETFHQPAVVVGKHGETWRGSGRTLNGINIKEVLDKCSDLFVKYGGHADAVGVEVKSDKVLEAPAVFNQACKEYIEKNNISMEKKNYYDAKLSIAAVSPKTSEFVKEKLYPYCDENNAQPVFMLPNVKITNLTVKDGKGWRLLKFKVEKDGEVSKYPFKIFSSKFSGDLEGVNADVFFMFSQKYRDSELQVVDIVKRKNE
jgi:single-stranded-DNA-specific exonuclease